MELVVGVCQHVAHDHATKRRTHVVNVDGHDQSQEPLEPESLPLDPLSLLELPLLQSDAEHRSLVLGS